jgi:hypothetical protein
MKLIDDRYMEWQRRLAPFSGTLVCLSGLALIVSAIVPNPTGIFPDLNLKERIVIGLLFEVIGTLFLFWGLKKKPATKHEDQSRSAILKPPTREVTLKSAN